MLLNMKMRVPDAKTVFSVKKSVSEVQPHFIRAVSGIHLNEESKFCLANNRKQQGKAPTNLCNCFLLVTLLGSAFASLSYLIFLYNPLEIIIGKYAGFYPNSIIYGLWKDPPYDIFLKVYLFNVTNPNEFLDGTEKLTLKEVGPYVYKEMMYNNNITFNNNGTVSFTPKRKLKFLPEHSVGDPTTDRLLLPNVPLLGITGALVDQSMFVQIGLSSVSKYLGSEPFLNLTITDYLYGYDDPLVTLANDYIPSWIDFSKFGILDRIMNLDNDSSVVTLNINPAIKRFGNTLPDEEQQMEPFSIQVWDGFSGLRQWGFNIPTEDDSTPQNSKCSLVEGCFMGTLFPRNIKKNTTLYLYRRAFCRPVPIKHEKSIKTKHGFDGYFYRVEEDFLERSEENSDNECFCKTEKCLPKGVGDLSPCYYDIPIAMSQPHFYNSDPMLLKSVNGLHPIKEKHDFTMIIHPQLGAPLEANLRVQINLVMPTTYYNFKTKPFNDLIIPLFWVDLGVEEVPSIVSFYITLLYDTLPVVQQVIMYSFAIVGFVLIGGSAVVVVISNKSNTTQKSFHVNYSQIPVFALRNKLLNSDVLIHK